ncbi:hypothetical protein BRD00_09995 [Halobacteriales archaeon QS_8_69_26]|nr:MAG: hypothetical protein BRD00_09995 [Halobacteriales archaeon QS_8_69_26]
MVGDSPGTVVTAYWPVAVGVTRIEGFLQLADGADVERILGELFSKYAAFGRGIAELLVVAGVLYAVGRLVVEPARRWVIDRRGTDRTIAVALRRGLRGAIVLPAVAGGAAAAGFTAFLDGSALLAAAATLAVGFAAVLYPFLGIGPPAGTYLMARGLERRLDAEVVAGGALSVGIWLDYGLMGVTHLPVDVVVQRRLLVVTLGLIAAGAARRATRESRVNGMVVAGGLLWILLLAGTLFGYLRLGRRSRIRSRQAARPDEIYCNFTVNWPDDVRQHRRSY